MLGALGEAWEGLAQEASRLGTSPAPLQEVAAGRLAEALYHALAASLLARAAAALPGGAERRRAIAVAEAYAACHVSPGGAEGQRALERLALEAGEELAYGAAARAPPGSGDVEASRVPAESDRRTYK